MFGNETPRLLGAVMFPRVDWERMRTLGQAVGAFAKSTFRLLGALCTSGFGALLIAGSVVMVRLPDSLLLQQAVANAARRHEALPQSALAERDLDLVIMAIGAVILFLGLHAIETWWRGTSKE
jgi:hypothetical protein